MNRRVFLTGGSGFLGNNIFKRLKNDDIYLYERGEDMRGLIDFKPDVIIHCAGEIYDETKMFDSNVRLTYDLLEASRKNPFQAFIYIGSSSEYGRKNHPMSEADFLDPTTMYEATKGAGSLMCQAYAQEFNLPIMVARPFSLYGLGEPQKRFIPTLIKSAKAGWEMMIAPGVHDFIHIDDFIDGLFMLIDHPTKGVFNFGTGNQLSNDDVVEIVEEIVGRKIKRKAVPKMHTYDSECWVADISKVKQLGWEPKISFYKGIEELCRHTQS